MLLKWLLAGRRGALPVPLCTLIAPSALASPAAKRLRDTVPVQALVLPVCSVCRMLVHMLRHG